jgi:hypothetical protein
METLIEGDWQGYLMLGRGLVGGQVHVKDAERRIKVTEREVQVCLPKDTDCRLSNDGSKKR